MNRKRTFIVAIGLFVLGLMLTACTRSLSSAPETNGAQQPLATPTVVGALPTSVTADAMSQLMAFGTQTAMAEQGITGATDEAATDTAITPVVATTEAPAEPTAVPPTATPTPEPVIVTTPQPSAPPTSITVPSSYTLQAGEFPYCIARRFNINPDQLLTANGLEPSQGRIFYPGLTLTIPQNAGPFPAERALRTHPDIYTVQTGEETIYSIACQYGDVDPLVLADYNGLTAPYTLVPGDVLEIP